MENELQKSQAKIMCFGLKLFNLNKVWNLNEILKVFALRTAFPFNTKVVAISLSFSTHIPGYLELKL
jgi:hypothetical protein